MSGHSRRNVNPPPAGADAVDDKDMVAPPAGVPGTRMKTPLAPLGKSATSDPLDWHEVERRPEIPIKDVLGLQPADRAALGMSAARTVDTVPHVTGDAHAALVEALARGGSVGKARETRRHR